MWWSMATSLLPIIGISLAIIISIYKIYFRIRLLFKKTVNCWFCNQYTRVPYLEANSWYCPSCEQYNGFSKDGDYNREISEQYENRRLSHRAESFQDLGNNSRNSSNNSSTFSGQNGLCESCNEMQRIKVERLAQFQPKFEWRFDKELKQFKTQLEDQYRLCNNCKIHVKRVLREKKKMVLGLKFLDFIMKGTTIGTNRLQRTVNNVLNLKKLRNFRWKQRIRLNIIVLTIINMFLTTLPLPSFAREDVIRFLGEFIGGYLFIYGCHILAFWRALISCLTVVLNNVFSLKLFLFIRTIFIMLLFSIGIRLPDTSFNNIFLDYICPYIMLALSFLHNAFNGFQFGRHTFLLAVWSVYAGQYYNTTFLVNSHLLKFFISLMTFILMHWSNETDIWNSFSRDCSINSFRKIHSSDDYDDDTISFLSQEYSGNPTTLSTSSIQYSMNYNNKTSPSSSSTFLTQNPVNFIPSTNFNTFSKTSIFNSPFQSLSTTFGTNLHQRISLQSYQQYPEQCQMQMANHCQSATSDLNFQTNYNFGNYRNERSASGIMRSLSNNSLHSIGSNCLNIGNGNNGDEFRPISSMNGVFSNYSQRMSGKRHINDININGIHSTISDTTNSWCNNINYNNKPSDLLRPTKFNALHLNSAKRFNDERLLLNSSSNRNNANSLFQTNLLQMNGGNTGDGDNISRASSQSSGFESQYEHTNRSRENSCDPDSFQKTLINADADIITQDTFSKNPSWHTAAIAANHRRTMNNLPCESNPLLSDNLFNLQAINEELPAII